MKTVHLSNQERLNLISNLSTLLSSGIPILEAVESLTAETKGNLRKVLIKLKEDLGEGKSVSESFAKLPGSFDPIIINLIKASEESGTLDKTLKDVTLTIKKDIEFSNKIKNAMAYPIMVLVVLFSVLIINLFFVIPRIATVFTRLRVQLPLPTRILMATSNFVTQNTITVILAIIIFAALLLLLAKRKRSIFFRIFSTLPLISKLVLEIDITHFCRSMALLLSSGIPIVQSINLSSEVVNRSDLKTVIKESSRLVTGGKKLEEGLKKGNKLIPPFMVRVIAAGEKSGTLEKSMQELSEQFDERVSTRLHTLTTLIEPILLLVVGLLVGGLMLSIIAPIYNLIGKISPR